MSVSLSLDLNCSTSSTTTNSTTADDSSSVSVSISVDETAGGVDAGAGAATDDADNGAGSCGITGENGDDNNASSKGQCNSVANVIIVSHANDGAVAGPSRHYHQHQQQQQPQPNNVQPIESMDLVAPQPEQNQLVLHVADRAAIDESYREFCEQFQFENLQCCWICNGYYAPNFGEPVCGVCHSFVFSMPNHEGIKVQVTMLSDDEDSGNDEPPYKDRAETDEADEDDGEDDEEEEEEEVDEAREEEPEMELEVAVDEDVDVDVDVDEDVDVDGADVDIAPAIEGHIDDEGAAAVGPAVAIGGAIGGAAAIAAQRVDFARQRQAPPQPPLRLNQYIDLLSQPHDAHQLGGMAGIEALPVEVLLAIFKHLDDVSLWHVSKVCRRWRTILETNIPAGLWLRFVRERWPLFVPAGVGQPARSINISTGSSWFDVYSELMGSAFCASCLVQMGLKTPLPGRIAQFRSHRLRCDFRAMELDDVDGIAAKPLDKSMSHWQATIAGPAGSPYEDGKFFLYIVFPCQYPMQPPTVRFITKIIHPNVSRHGDVGCDIIQHNWSLALTISKLLLSVQSLLTDPFTEICMEPQVGRLFAEDRPRFNALARCWTRKYAMLELMLS